jgi:hypothetical protein
MLLTKPGRCHLREEASELCLKSHRAVVLDRELDFRCWDNHACPASAITADFDSKPTLPRRLALIRSATPCHITKLASRTRRQAHPPPYAGWSACSQSAATVCCWAA